MKRLWTALLVFGVILAPWISAAVRADVPIFQITGSLSAVATSPPISIQGQPSCGIVVSGTYTGATLVPQVSTNYPAGNTWVTATGINSGSIAANGTYVGNISTQGLSGFRLSLTAISTGTLNYVITCSPADIPGTASGASAGPTSSPGGVPVVAVACPSTEPGAVGSLYLCTIDSAGKLQVNTPAPATTGAHGGVVVEGVVSGVAVPVSVAAIPNPTATMQVNTPAPCSTATCATVVYQATAANLNATVNTPAPLTTVATYLVPSALMACPSTAPAAANSTYLATCDSSGNVNVNLKTQGTPVPVPSTFATVVATTGPLAVVAGAATVFSGFFTNSSAATVYCNLYNVAAASVTAGTTQPLIMVAVPAGQTMPFFTPPTQGLTFGTAVSHFCATALNGGTSVTASNVWVSVFYR